MELIIRGLIYPALADVLADVLLVVIMLCELDLLLPNLATSLMERRLYCGSLDTMILSHHRGSEPRGLAELTGCIKESIKESLTTIRRLYPQGVPPFRIGRPEIGGEIFG